MSLTKIISVAALAATAALVPATANAAPTPVRVVRPGQLVAAGHGEYLELTGTQRCYGPLDAFSCKSVVDGNQPAGTVSIQIEGDADGTFYTPLYIGDGRAARMTVTDGGTTYDVQVVTLAGHPGYSTGYVWGAPLSGPPVGGDVPQVTVYDAAGTVLASL